VRRPSARRHRKRPDIVDDEIDTVTDRRSCRDPGNHLRDDLLLIATFPATWLLMLFLGNVGANVSYWGALPLGILASVLLAGVTSPNVAVVRSQG
jgi:hypothetical protein